MFFTDLVVAAGAPHTEVLAALWELVWAGAITNDTLAPVRALLWPKRGSGPSPRGIRRLPAESAGRWSLVRHVAQGETAAALTARARARAEGFLQRLGIVTREGVAAEDIAGGFSAVYPVLRALEETGRVRRGYFVEGLGAAQFALPGAAERARAERERRDEPVVAILAASDPAQPYGATLAWPREDGGSRKPFQRVAGARVVFVDGIPVVYLDRAHKGLMTLTGASDKSALRQALNALANDGPSLGLRGLSIERVDGSPAGESALAEALQDAGFVRGFRGFSRRPERAWSPAHA